MKKIITLLRICLGLEHLYPFFAVSSLDPMSMLQQHDAAAAIPAAINQRTPRNAEQYVARRVLARDRPFLAHVPMPQDNEDDDDDYEEEEEEDRVNNFLDADDAQHYQSTLPAGVLPEQYKSKLEPRPSERRNNVDVRTAGRGWSCPKHVCFRPLGVIQPTSNKRSSASPQKKQNKTQDGDGDNQDEGAAELVAQRLQDAQAMFGGEEATDRKIRGPPSTQLGKFSFPRWKPTYHATGGARHV